MPEYTGERDVAVSVVSGGRGLWCVRPVRLVADWSRRERGLHGFLGAAGMIQRGVVDLDDHRPVVRLDVGDVVVTLQLLDLDWRDRGLFKAIGAMEPSRHG